LLITLSLNVYVLGGIVFVTVDSTITTHIALWTASSRLLLQTMPMLKRETFPQLVQTSPHGHRIDVQFF